MLGYLSLTSLCVGAALAHHAPRTSVPEVCETLGGLALLTGLVLIGAALPVFR